MTDSCKYCGHKSRHRSVAARHVWRVHRTTINNSDLLLHDFTPGDIALTLDQTETRCSGRSVADCSASINVSERYVAQTQSRPVTDGTVPEVTRSGGDATTSTTISSDTDKDRLYRCRLVAASANRTSLDKSEMCRSADFDLLGPSMNPVLQEQESACFQSPPSRWNHLLTSGSYRHGKRNCLSSDWLCKSAPSAAGSSLSYCSLSPFATDRKTLERSGMDSARRAIGHCATRLDEENALFQKQAESLHSECQQSCAAERFACPLCSLSYKRVADLNRHTKQKHWTSLTDRSSSSSLHAASVSTAREAPLNLTLKGASFSQPACRKQLDHTCSEDAPQDLPLDLSTNSKTLKSNECSVGQSSERLFDRVNDWRSVSNQMLPPFMLKTCDVSSKNAPSKHCRGAVSLSPASTIPSFYASFTKFMESTYNPAWKSYFDGMMGQNATAVRSETKSSRDSVFSDDLKQMNMDRFSVNSNVVELPRLSTVDNNNNDNDDDDNMLKYDEPSDISAGGTDVLRPAIETETGSDGFGSKDAGPWGQCPLCPFVCPHPLVMRRHLDIHDEPQLQRTAHSHQTAVNLNSAAASACKTCFELGAAGRQDSLLDITGSLKTYFDGAGRASASTSGSTWKSAFAAGSDGTGASGVSVLTRSTASWLPGCSEFTPRAAGKSASWSSTPAVMVKSPAVQTAPGQAIVPFPCSSQPPGTTEDWQPCECSRSRPTSRSAKDVKEHIADVHPAGGHVMTSAASAAKTTTPWWSLATQQCRVPLPPPTSTDAGGWWRGWTPHEQPWSTYPGLPATVNRESAAAAVTTVHSTRAADTPLSSSTHMHATDFKVTLRLQSSHLASRESN